MTLNHTFAWAVSAIALAGCLKPLGNSDSNGNGGGPNPPVISTSGGTPAPGPASLRRLTATEYANTVNNLFGTTMANPPGQSAPNYVGFTLFEYFDNNGQTQNVPSADMVSDYHDAAASLATAANLATLLTAASAGCSATAPTDTCVKAFIQSFGQKALRRPLTSDEQTALFALYTDTSGTTDDAPTRVRRIIEALLQFPDFVFHLEAGDTSVSGDVLPLSGYEIASRLSYFLWATMPDDTLFADAAAGTLLTADGLGKEVDRMLADPRAKQGVKNFYEQWLQLANVTDDPSFTKSTALYAGDFSKLRASMRAEVENFFDYVIWDPTSDGKFNTLLTANYSFLDANLAGLYGSDIVGAAPTGTTFTKTTLQNRAGFLTQPAYLAYNAHDLTTSPPHRGLFIAASMLKVTVPPPPPGAQLSQPAVADPTPRNLSFARTQTQDGGCAVCHGLMDPLGLAFENFDALGEPAPTVDATDDPGTMTAEPISPATGLSPHYNGGVSVVTQLAADATVSNNFAETLLEYGIGRYLIDSTTASPNDAQTIASMQKQFAASGGNIVAQLKAIALSDAFRFTVRTQGGN